MLSTDELSSMVYEDLRQIADRLMGRQGGGVTLQPTALVHEVYMNLAGHDEAWEGRAHFLAVASTAMRRLLVDAARTRGREKRGGGWERVTLSSQVVDGPDTDLMDLDQALKKLGQFNERLVETIELRYFGGLTIGEVAELRGVSRTIIVREWAKAKTILMTLLEDAANQHSDET